MSMTLSIPIHQTMTLPDNWQACKTPQELSYWLIAKFEAFEAAVIDLNTQITQLDGRITANAADITALQQSVTELNTLFDRVDQLEFDLNQALGDISAIGTRVAALETSVGSIGTQITQLDGRVTSNTTNINAIGGRVSTLETGVSNINTQLTQLDGRITSNTTNINAIGATVQTHETRIGNAETQITQLDQRVAGNTVDITSLKSRVTALEALPARVTQIEYDLGQVMGDITSIGATLQTLQTGKQNVLTAGSGISIASDTISVSGVPYLTTAPVADNTDGTLKFVVLTAEPATRYNGYMYLIVEPTLINFTIDQTSYQAEDGMTWDEWVHSAYNTDGFIYGPGVFDSTQRYQVQLNYTNVSTYDIIEDSASYDLVQIGP